MLTFNLKKEWYKKIRSGEKTIEYRDVKPYWKKRLEKEICGGVMDDPISEFFHSGRVGDWVHVFLCDIRCVLRLGYTKRFMTARITRIEIVDGKDTDLAIDALVYAIHLAGVKEVT